MKVWQLLNNFGNKQRWLIDLEVIYRLNVYFENSFLLVIFLFVDSIYKLILTYSPCLPKVFVQFFNLNLIVHGLALPVSGALDNVVSLLWHDGEL